jgi:hypothetical protein
MYSIKKLSFDTVIDITTDLFSSTIVPQQLLQAQNIISSGGTVLVSGGGSSTTINAAAMDYLTQLTDRIGIYSNSTTVTVAATARINPTTLQTASKNEFDIYINGQYADKLCYTWTPSDMVSQTITFNTATLGYTIDPQDIIIVKGRWA